VPALGGPERKLATTHSQWPPATPISWSPDGKDLAFVDFTLAGYSAPLFLLSLDTLERRRVATGCPLVQAQAFSPSGDTLAYVCDEDLARVSLNLFSLNEGKSTRIFAGPITIASVAWSRDGKRLIFAFDFSFMHGGAGELWQVAPVPGGVPEKVSIGHDVE